MSAADRPRFTIVPTPGDNAAGEGDRDTPHEGINPAPGRERLATPADREHAQLQVRGPVELLPDDDRELTDPPDDVREIEGTVVDRPDTSIALRVAGQVARLPRSEQALTVGRVVLRETFTTAQGVHSWWRRAWDGLTRGVHRRQIRLHEATGDSDRLAEWVDRRNAHANDRMTRLMNLFHAVLGVLKVTLLILIGAPILLFLVAFLVWVTGAGDFTTVWIAAGNALRWLFTAIGWAWTPAKVAAPILLVYAAWREGRRAGIMPGWLITDPEEKAAGRDVIPDEGAILNALRHLGIPELNRAFKAGWRPRFVLPTERDGKGYHTQLELPEAVTVEKINNKKKVLAHNLVRFPVEVWLTEPRTMPGVLDVWVADQGALTGPVPQWPLLHDGEGDYFKGIPVAVDIRGKTIVGRLFEANYAIAGMMGSGKSTLIIILLLGALLDPLVDADVFVMAVNADYKPMKPRLRTLMTGTGREVVEACLNALRDAYDSLSVRGKALDEHNARAVTRELAEKDPRLRPRIIVIDECQALFMDEEYGEEAEEVSVKLENAARKYAVTVVKATPEASSDSLPRRIMTITSNKACFAIGDQTSNDAVLGTGSYKAGISAVGLEPKTDEGPGDVGTFMGRGFTAKPGLLRGYYVSQAEAGQVVERAVAIRERADVRATQVQTRDLLEDLTAVMGEEPIPSADLPALLARHAPQWLPYRTLTGKQLRQQLAGLGVRVPSTGNRWPVSRSDVVEVLARRQLDDEEADS